MHKQFLNKLSMIFAGFLISTIAVAQSPTQALDTHLSATKNFQADFTQSTNSPQFGMQTSQGTMAIERPGKFRWHVEDPDNQLLISNGEVLWIYDQDLEQVIIQAMSGRLDETPALLLLAGEVESLEEFFTVTTINSEQPGFWYELTALDQEGLVNKVVLGFNNQNIIIEMQIYDNLEQRTDILFNNAKANVNLPGDYFSFTPPAGVDVISELPEFNE